MAWSSWWKRHGRQPVACSTTKQIRSTAPVVLTRLRETGRFIKEHAKPLAKSILAWLQSAWQAARSELQRTWKNLKPLHLPQGWQGRALLVVLVLTILIPGVTYYLSRQVLPPPAAQPLPVPVRADDTNLLARLVAAEAGDEPYPGQVAVVAVVLNRLRDPAFPKTIADIIFEPWAFESVANGHYWQVDVRGRDYAATHDALNDWDPSNGALYFFNPATATSAWIWTRPQITRIGSHIFTR